MSPLAFQDVATKKIVPSQKIFVDSHPTFGDHDLVIAFQTMTSTLVTASRPVAAGQPKLPYGNRAESPRRTAIEFGW
jgi:hypothetical protein